MADLIVMRDLAETDLITLFPHNNLTTAPKKFGLKDIEVIPVVSPDDERTLLGLLNHKDVINAYNRGILIRELERQNR